MSCFGEGSVHPDNAINPATIRSPAVLAGKKRELLLFIVNPPQLMQFIFDKQNTKVILAHLSGKINSGAKPGY